MLDPEDRKQFEVDGDDYIPESSEMLPGDVSDEALKEAGFNTKDTDGES